MQNGYGQLPTPELLDDLCTRFILNVPAVELESFEKLMFLVEQAHWYYEDFCRARDLSLRSMSLRAFSALVFQRCPGLAEASRHQEAILQRFNAFKSAVPAMGTILLNPALDKCLLCRGFSASASWGFPAGKVNKDESDAECAVRETLEETGLDVGALLVESDFIEVHTQQKRRRMYIITGVPESTPFAPLMRGEIGGYAWHSVAELPATQEASTLAFHTPDGARHKFHMVWPFIKQLRTWIARQRKRGNGRGSAANPAAVAAAAAAAAAVAGAGGSAPETAGSGLPSASPGPPAQAGPGAGPGAGPASPPQRRPSAAIERQVAASRSPAQRQPPRRPPGGLGAAARRAGAAAEPASTRHVHAASAEPGQAWLAFSFDRVALAKALLTT